MYAGEIIEQGAVAEVFDNPLHPYTRGLLRAVPRLGARQEKLYTIPGSVPRLSEIPAGCVFYPRCEEAAGECVQSAVALGQPVQGWCAVSGEWSRRLFNHDVSRFRLMKMHQSLCDYSGRLSHCFAAMLQASEPDGVCSILIHKGGRKNSDGFSFLSLVGPVISVKLLFI
jgi:oligopeptide/dipeptide ABC transporter ATP-binding protein